MLRITTILLAMLFVAALPASAQPDSVLLNKSYAGMPYPQFAKAIEQDWGIRLLSNSPKSDSLVVVQDKVPMYLGDVLMRSFAGSKFSYYAYSPTMLVVLDDYEIFDRIPRYFLLDPSAATEEPEERIEFLSEEKKLKKKKAQSYNFGSPSDNVGKRRAVLSGQIVDSKTGEPVVGAVVLAEGLNTGVSADVDGRFKLDLPQGRHSIVIRSMGSEEQKLTVNLFANGAVQVEMKEQTTEIGAVNVIANRINNVQSVQMGVESIEIKTIKSLPSALGEVDIVKAAIMLPGVQTVGEGASGFNVRGGGVDQNLILLDGAPIFNSSHLFGFFSVFNQDVVDDFTLYKSGIPTEFGGRVSSVLDVTTRSASRKDYTVALGVGPITSRIFVEAPIVQDRTSVLIAARTTYSDWLLKKVDDPRLSNSSASFWDGNLKLSHSINKNNLLKISFYRSGDKFRLDSDTSFNYKNTCASAKWSHVFSHDLSLENTVAYSNYWYAIESQSVPADGFQMDYNIRYLSAGTLLKYSPRVNNKITAGATAERYSLTPSALHPLGDQSLVTESEEKQGNAMDLSLFAGDEWQATEKLLFYGGIRGNVFLSTGKRDEYQYQSGLPLSMSTLIDTVQYGKGDIAKTYFAIEPRLSLRYKLGANNSVKASYNRMTQNVHMLSNSAAVSPTDTWTLSGKYIKPQHADIYSLGYYHNLRDNAFETSVEVYYKNVKNVLDYKGGAKLLLNNSIETDLLQGLQEAYGIEFLVRKKVGNLTGWIGYTYSVSRMKMDSPFKEEQVNSGKYYPSNYDKPHDIILVGNQKFNRRLSFSSSVTYSTGRPITFPVAQYKFKEKTMLHYSDRNEYRVPDYFRWDVSVNIEGNLKNKKIAHSYWSISVYNLTGRDNVYSIFFKSDNRGNLNGYQMSIFPRPLLTVAYNIKF